MMLNRQIWLRTICGIAVLLAVALMPVTDVGELRAQEHGGLQLTPLNPDFAKFWQEPPEHFYGYVPPPMDLSHLDAIPVEKARGAATLPNSFDWRDTGKVTSVKDQNPCGTCWVHGTLAAVESKVLIEESTTYDFSEQNLACCTDPAWVYLIGNRCMGGGWSWLAADTLTKKGTRLEACQPYNTDTINTESCDDSCQSVKMVTDYRMIANEATSPDVIEPIKNAIYNHGPLAISYAADDGEHMNDGSIYYWPDCPASEVNHLVCIVGWDDGIAHPAGGGSGAWIVKNSWGTGWGDSGYFYLCYGSAGMSEVASLDYKDYDSNEHVYYWDEAGQVVALGNWEDYSGWMASMFTSSQDGSLTHVDFWTTSNNAQYHIYVYLDGDISDDLQNLATSQSGTCEEFGYYSIPLTSPVSLSDGQPFTIAVKMTTPGYSYPLPVEYQLTQEGNPVVDPPIQSGKSFFRHGDAESWTDTATQNCNACLRGRVTTGEAAGQPDITVDPTSFEKTLPPGTTQDYTLSIGNAGEATLTYSISDRETTGHGSTAGDENLALKPASMKLEVPLEGSPVAAGDIGEADSGWQDMMTDGFEGAFPGAKWQLYGSPTWGKESYRHHTGSCSVWCASSGYSPPSDYPNNMEAWMIYGPFSLEDAADAELNFWFWNKSQGPGDYVMWGASIDGSSFWGSGHDGNSGGWQSISFDLTDVYALGNLCGESEAWIAFIFGSDYMITDEGAFIDDLVLRQYVAAGNNPPNIPSNPSPADEATGVSVNADLSWTGGDPDTGDTVNYDVYFGTSASPPLVSNHQSPTTYDPGTLNNDTKYYWKIVATDNRAASTTGPVWELTTGGATEDCSWLSESPSSGSVAPGSPADSITVAIDTTGLAEDDYSAEVVILSNDPDENPKTVPVTLHVGSSNNAPNTPSNPSPANDATGVPINADLSWTGGDPDAGDTVTYDVYFGTGATPPLVSNDQSATTYDPGALNNNTKYYWKIVAADNHAASTSGSVWDFTTGTSQAASVSIEPQSVTVAPSGTFNVDVWVDAAGRDLNGIDVAVQYNSNAMTTTVADMEAHNLLGGMEIGPEVNEAAGVGEVTYALASADAVAGVDAPVMTIHFTMDPDAEPGVVYPLTVSKADLSDLGGTWGDTEINNGAVTVTTQRKGDFNGDGDINIYDFVQFATAYGSELGDDNYNLVGDFDNNDRIDIYDFVQFATVYGT